MSDSTIFERITKNDAILLATTPLLADLIVVATYYPLFEKYHIPIYFLKPDLVEVLLLSLLTVFSFLLGQMIVTIFIARSPLKINFSVFVFLTFTFTAFKIADWQDSMGLLAMGEQWRVVAKISGFLMIAAAVSKYILSRQEKVKLPRWVSWAGDTLFVFYWLLEPAYKQIRDFIGTKGLVFLVLIFEVLTFSYSTGDAFAQVQSSFLLANTTPECAVLYMNSEYAICSPLDPTSKMIAGGFKVLYLKDNPDIVFSPKAIGPLSSQPLATNQIVIQTPAVTVTISSNATFQPSMTETPSLNPSVASTPAISPSHFITPIP